LPHSWQLLWTADEAGITFVADDSTAGYQSGTAKVITLEPASTPIAQAANEVTAHFAGTSESPPPTAYWLLDLASGSRGKLKAVALDPADPDSVQVIESNEVTFNGGIEGDYAPAILRTSSDHPTSTLYVTAVGSGLDRAETLRLSSPDTSWSLPLQILTKSSTSISAQASASVQLPESVVQAGSADAMNSSTGLLSAEQLLSSPIIPRDNSYLMVPESLGALPKDFAFVYNVVPTSEPHHWRGLYHLVYIRHQADGTENSFGHAWSSDLENWSVVHDAFAVSSVGWDKAHVWAPSIVQNGDAFQMFYTGVDSVGNQRIGKVSITTLDTTNTVWGSDRTMVFSADSISWGVVSPSNQQFRDPFVFPDPNPDSLGRFLMVYSALDSAFQTHNGLSVGLARNRQGTLNRWRDLGRYEAVNWANNGAHIQAVEGPIMVPDWGGPSNTRWRLMYSWGFDVPPYQSIRFVESNLGTSINDTRKDSWGSNTNLYDYLYPDSTVRGWNGSEHLRVGDWNYLAGFNADYVDGIQISRMNWNGSDFTLTVPSLTAVDDVGSQNKAVALGLVDFSPGRRDVVLRISLPTAQRVRLTVFDVLGRRVASVVDGPLPVGETQFRWEGGDQGGVVTHSGMYFARLSFTGGNRVVRFPIVR
jgi:hypothetical protein